MLLSYNNTQKKCGFCGENIPVGARRCPYCASVLEVSFDDSYRIESTDVKTGMDNNQENPAQNAAEDDQGIESAESRLEQGADAPDQNGAELV